MSMPQRDPTAYRVGDLSIDLGTRQVSRAGQALFLPKLSYELLIALVHEPRQGRHTHEPARVIAS